MIVSSEVVVRVNSIVVEVVQVLCVLLLKFWHGPCVHCVHIAGKIKLLTSSWVNIYVSLNSFRDRN